VPFLVVAEAKVGFGDGMGVEAEDGFDGLGVFGGHGEGAGIAVEGLAFEGVVVELDAEGLLHFAGGAAEDDGAAGETGRAFVDGEAVVVGEGAQLGETGGVGGVFFGELVLGEVAAAQALEIQRILALDDHRDADDVARVGFASGGGAGMGCAFTFRKRDSIRIAWGHDSPQLLWRWRFCLLADDIVRRAAAAFHGKENYAPFFDRRMHRRGFRRFAGPQRGKKQVSESASRF